MPTRTYDPEKLTPEQNAVIESILKMAKAEIPKCAWKPAKDDLYFFYDSNGIVYSTTWDNADIDNARYNCGVCYQTEEEALFAVERNKVIAELTRFAAKHREDIDWADFNVPKFRITYCHGACEISVDQTYRVQTGDVHFSSEEIAYDAIRTVGEERLKKYYFSS